MRNPLIASATLAALLIAGALAPNPVAAQPQQMPAAAPPKPYKVVPVQLPQPLKDATFEAFRKQLAAIAQKKDRAGFARLIVAQIFYGFCADKDNADRRRPGIDNSARALGLDSRDGSGWDLLGSYAAEATAEPDPQRKGVVCSPADPIFDEKGL